ncbi:hypothetical protein JCM14076_21540 [Methylosoma difficile]
MKNNTILLVSALLASPAVLADFNLLESAGKQLLKNAATNAAPETVKNVEAASQAVEQAQQLKNGVPNAASIIQNAVKQQATEVVKDKITNAVGGIAPNAVQNLGAAVQVVEQAQQLKNGVPNAGNIIQNAVEQRAADVVKDKITNAVGGIAPNAVQNLGAASQVVEQVQQLKNGVPNAGNIIQNAIEQRAADVVKDKITNAVGGIAPNAVQNLGAAQQVLDQANQLKSLAANPADAAKQMAKERAQQEINKGVMDLLR